MQQLCSLRRPTSALWSAVFGLLWVFMTTHSNADAVRLPATEQFDLRNAAGQTYQIMVSLPNVKKSADSEPSAKPPPVLYVLDGNATFAAFHDAKRMESKFANSIIVAVAYPTEKPFDFYRRSYDFSPPVSDAKNDPPQGGQDAFIDFLENRLQPEIARRYSMDNSRQAIYGHSFGGMFTLYAMFNRPELFNHYIVSSPSLWWHDSYLLAPEQRFSEQVRSGETSVIGKSLLMVVAEGDPIQEKEDAELISERLRPLSAYGLRSSFYLQEDENHMSLPVTIAHRVIRHAFTPER